MACVRRACRELAKLITCRSRWKSARAEDGAGEPAGTVVDIGASALPGVDATRTDHGPGPRHRFSPRDAAEDDVPLSPPTSPPYREMVGIVKKHTPNNVMS